MKRKLFWWIKRNFRLIIRDEGNLRESAAMRGSALGLLSGVFLAFALLSAGIFLLSWHVSRYYYEQNNQKFLLNKKVMRTSHVIDSLQSEIEQNDQYIQSLYAVLEGDVSYLASEELAVPPPLSTAKEKEETLASGAPLPQERAGHSPRFFPPVVGYITDKFDPKIDHLGVDIVAKNNDEPVKAMGDGTVMFSSWTQDGGHVLAIQHHNHFVSVYKHNARLLKRLGAYVSVGDPIAFMGNTGELTTGPHVHLELWWKGIPLDPELFVRFRKES